MQAGRYFMDSNDRPCFIPVYVGNKQTSCLLFICEVSSLSLLLSFSELHLLVSKPFQQLVMADTV